MEEARGTLLRPRRPIGVRAPDIEASTDRGDLQFWKRLPGVEAAELIDLRDERGPLFDLYLWLAPEALRLPVLEAARADRPNRARDFRVSGEGEPPAFWTRLPDVEHQRLYWEPDRSDPDAPNGWWFLEVWLRPAACSQVG